LSAVLRRTRNARAAHRDVGKARMDDAQMKKSEKGLDEFPEVFSIRSLAATRSSPR
jgi:predicted MarR family transcription regulator